MEYTRTFFGAAVAERAADGLLALERNWDGPLAVNGSVDATLALWRQLEEAAPQLSGNWRWQLYLLRAYYDAYTRHRLIRETRLEHEANEALGEARRVGVDRAVARATTILNRAAVASCCPAWHDRIVALCKSLFDSIRLQTSVPKYSASGYERGAVLDFLDVPLNDRWWLEDEFDKLAALPDEGTRLARLDVLRTWSDPPAGSSYDDVGNISAAPHVSRQTRSLRTGELVEQTPHFTWEGGPSRTRLSWLTSLRWPASLTYDHLDPAGEYEVRLHVITDKTAGQVALRIDGERAAPVAPARDIGELLVYRVAASALSDGRLVLTFDPVDESDRNWRQYSRLVEAWLIRQPAARSSTEAR
jgi:hypothetical protein